MSRIEKVNELIKEEVSRSLSGVVGEDVGLVTVLKADVTKDLKKADVWVSVLGEDEEEKFEIIKSKTSLIQQGVAEKIKLKFTPRIEFHLDKSGQYAAHIEKILRSLNQDDQEK